MLPTREFLPYKGFTTNGITSKKKKSKVGSRGLQKMTAGLASAGQ